MDNLHLPVLTRETIDHLVWREAGLYVDATVGDGGHAGAVLERLRGEGRLIGIDWDEEALERARRRLEPYIGRLTLIYGSYTALPAHLASLGFKSVDGILLDLGASTLQLTAGRRGFSIHQHGKLDMRMDCRNELTAAEVINCWSAGALEEIFFRLGEERWSRRIAQAIVREREQSGPIEDSTSLAALVREAIPARYRRHGGHPARRIFQALRLAVNRELENIREFLPRAFAALHPGGRLCIIAYHSLEDRLVKQYFQEMSRSCSCPPRVPCQCDRQAAGRLITRGALKPGAAEIAANPRARSARLRCLEKLEATVQ